MVACWPSRESSAPATPRTTNEAIGIPSADFDFAAIKRSKLGTWAQSSGGSPSPIGRRLEACMPGKALRPRLLQSVCGALSSLSAAPTPPRLVLLHLSLRMTTSPAAPTLLLLHPHALARC